MMTDESVLLREIIRSLFLDLFDHKRLLFDVLLQLEHLEGLLTEQTYKWVLRVRVEENIKVISLLSSCKLDLRLTPHPFRVPKCENCLSVTILAGDRSQVFGIAASRKGNPNPRMKGKVASVLKPLLLSRCIKLIVQNTRSLR